MTSISFFYYALLPGAIGYAIVWHAQKGPLNIGTVIAMIIAFVAIYGIAKHGRKSR